MKGNLVGNVLSLIFMDTKPEYIIKQDIWLEEYIKRDFNDKKKMEVIFDVISGFSEERRIKFAATFLEKNSDYEIFDSLELESGHHSWSGSELPLIDKRIEYYKKLESLMDGSKFIKHKLKINNIVDGLYKYRKKVIEEEFVGLWYFNK